MNILLLTQVLPYPPDAGPKIHILNKIQHLARRHSITLVSFIRPGEERYLSELQKICTSVHTVEIRRSRARDLFYLARSIVSGQSFLVLRDRSPAMSALVRRLVQSRAFDLVHVDQLNMAQFADGWVSCPRILDEHNATWTIPHRMYRSQSWGPRKLVLWLEWRKLQAYERRVCQQYDRVVVLSQEDLSALKCPDDRADRFRVIPIAIDTRAEKHIPRNTLSKNLISIGSMLYPPNAEGVLWFARHVFPRIRAQIPDVTFTIVGNRPPLEVVQLTDSLPGICVTGYVPSVAPYIARSAVMIVPLLSGSGMRWKILQGFAWGIPIVSTSMGCEGFGVNNDEHLIIADESETFADGVIRLLRDPALGTRLAANARAFAEKNHDADVVYGALDELYDELLHREAN